MPRPRILVIQHVPYEPLGTLDPLLKAAGFRIRYVNFGRDPEARPSLDGYAGLIVLGGPMSADQHRQYPFLATEIELLRAALERDMSVLGICLGAQLLACALGGGVRRLRRPEIGWHEVELNTVGRKDPVLSGFATTQRVFQWHEDGIDRLSNVELLASSEDCRVQAFRHGEHAYGFQFHLEVDSALIQRWLTVPANQAVLRRESSRVVPERLLSETEHAIEPLMSLSDKSFSRWIERFDLTPRRRRLPSR